MQMMPGMYGSALCPTPPFAPYSGIPPYGLNLQQYQQACYGQQAGYGQMGAYGQMGGVGQQGGYGQQAGYNPQAGYGQVNWQCLPWYRGPRDFFMWSEAQKEILTRETRPPFVP
jgi:hypothetical protein